MDVKLDKVTLKALSSDVRVDALKLLGSRRHMQSELASALSVAVPTMKEHLEALEKDAVTKTYAKIITNDKFGINTLIDYANNFSLKVIESEIKHYQNNKNFLSIMNQLKSFIEGYKKTKESSCIIKLGKGTGFFGMTICTLLDNNYLINLRKAFGIGRARSSSVEEPFSPRFPITHLVKVNESGIPILPIGWVKLTFGEQ